MESDKFRVDQVLLAMPCLSSSRVQYGASASRGLDLSVIDRFLQNSWIKEPNRRSPAVQLTETDVKLSEQLYLQHFGTKE